jgi:hypothetical protein
MLPVLSPRPRWLEGLRNTQARAEHQFMLPGLRFLFVAIVLSLSMLIFGLGATALLRSAHEEFVSLPTMRPQPETVFAQTEITRPTLALLRVDTPVTEQNRTDRPAVPDVPNATPPQEQPSPMASAEPAPAATEPNSTATEPDRSATPTAALPSEEKTESSDKSPETPAPPEKAARIEIPAPPPENQVPETPKLEAQVAVIQEPRPTAAVVATTAVSESTNAPTNDSAKAASVKIATLGGPPVTVEPQTASKIAVKPPTKRKQARHVIKRHRIARIPVAPPQPAQVGLFAAQPGG